MRILIFEEKYYDESRNLFVMYFVVLLEGYRVIVLI